jgi:hypothetical protein
MPYESDEDLRKRFAALQREEEAQAPAFAPSKAGAGPVVRFPVWKAAAGLLVAACAALWLLVAVGRHDKPLVIDLKTAVWEGPTAFLLETPGRDLLRTVPSVGEGVATGLGTQALSPPAYSVPGGRRTG